MQQLGLGFTYCCTNWGAFERRWDHCGEKCQHTVHSQWLHIFELSIQNQKSDLQCTLAQNCEAWKGDKLLRSFSGHTKWTSVFCRFLPTHLIPQGTGRGCFVELRKPDNSLSWASVTWQQQITLSGGSVNPPEPAHPVLFTQRAQGIDSSPTHLNEPNFHLTQLL